MALPGLPTYRSYKDILDADIREFVVANLPHDDIHRAELRAMSALDLLIIYMNWQLRIVSNERRQVHRSAALSASRRLNDAETRAGLAHIENILITGGNIHPHLSRRILNGYSPRQPVKKLNSRPDLDMLLNDWGLHHLHLSKEYSPDGFALRSRSLVIAAFKPGQAYLVDLISHGEWADDRLIKIIRREWPTAGLIHRLNGVLASGKPIGPADRRLMRDVGLSTMVEIGEETFVPSLGYSSSGVSTLAVTQADRLYRQVRQFAINMDADRDFGAREMARSGLIPVQGPDFHFTALVTGHFVIMDTGTGFAFHLR